MRGGAGSDVGARVVPGLEHQPALDGVRAVAVVLVLLFHGGVSWLPGGYLGVSVFFTLSGYLITSLLLREVVATGSVRVGAFYARRARRLLPASLVCIVGVTAAFGAGLFPGVGDLRRDLLGAIGQVANWEQLFAGDGYAELWQAHVGVRSPLDHYWSLAIEEQFYLLWPLAVALGARRIRAGRWSVVVGLATAAAMAAAPLLAWWRGPEVAYLATPARASELLTGATLAVLWQEGRCTRGRALLAPACLGLLLVLAALLPAGGGFAHRGGFPVVAVLSAGLLHGLQAPGPVRTVLAWRPIAALGVVSYGVYLFHWPLFLVLDEQRTGWDGPALLAARIGASVALAAGSYVLVERGIRRADWRPARTGFAAAVAVAWTVVLVAVTVQAPAPPLTPSPVAARAVAISASSELEVELQLIRSTPKSTGAVAASPVGASARILVLGDSTAMALGAGLVAWAGEDPDRAQVTVWAQPGCGFLREGVPEPAVDREGCAAWMDRIPSLLRELRPDAVVVLTSGSDILRRAFDGAEPATAEEPGYRRRLERAYRDLDRMILSTTDAAIGWVRPPTPEPFWLDRPPFPEGSWRVFDDVLARRARAHPTRSTVVDLRGYLERHGLDGAHDVRPDGIHLSEAAGLSIARDWLGPLLVDLAGGGERRRTVGT